MGPGRGGRRTGPRNFRATGVFKPLVRPIVAISPLIGLLLLTPSSARALPVAPAAFCQHYPAAPACAPGAVECTFCHTIPPTRNTYGASLEAALLPGAPRPLTAEELLGALDAALTAVEGQDSDGDGASNLEEILRGALPANKDDVPRSGACPGPAEQLGWDPCAADLAHTFRRIALDFCGQSPRAEDWADFRAAADKEAYLDRALDFCLASEHWRGKDGVLWNLANRKIKPTQSIKSGAGEGDIPLADYDDDYNLFVYTQIDDHDARELLTATYHVERADGAPTRYTPYTRSPREDAAARGLKVAQGVAVGRRAGMLTTRWFLMSNTMFTGIPRTTAAQAYRAFLGLDIAKMEGLFEVAGEPRDHDAKGVREPACAQCHSTLDPLTYPFAYYSGIGGEEPRSIPSSYVEDRPGRFTHVNGEGMAAVPERGSLFGRPVNDLLEWAAVAASSEAFARATVLDYWRLVIGGEPTPTQAAELERLWRRFMTEDRYSVERMLHALVETEAYRVP